MYTATPCVLAVPCQSAFTLTFAIQPKYLAAHLAPEEVEMPIWPRATKREWMPTAAQRLIMDRTTTLNSILYRVCRDHPKHRDQGAIRAKIMLIGQSSASGAERHVRGVDALAAVLRGARGWLDGEIEGLRSFRDHEPRLERIARIAAVHARVQGTLSSILRRRHNARSFVSKYLHFHAPVVPIYTRYAAAAMADWYQWPPRPMLARMPSGVDLRYWRHLVRTAFVVDEWRRVSFGAPTARAIDSYALAYWET